MDRINTRSQRIGPKVHKNHRIDSKWGMLYHNAIQDILFGKQCLPYMPTEPPPSLSEEIVESGPLYVCKQCKDCFRFQSSFEDHNTRHSWILGFWCLDCFNTVCTHTHITETGSVNAMCPLCMKKNSDKRSYLRAKGLHRSQRMGAVRVFYNQCQFVEHMKMHRLCTVNMGNLMLMTLPINVSDSNWSSEFEILCEALMERTFLLRIHIIDWLKMHNLQDKWWKLVNGKSDDSMINEIIDNYQGRQLFKIPDKSTANMNFDSDVIISPYNKSSGNIEFIRGNFMNKNTNDYSTDIISDKNILENEDNPCTPADITFVDCGPTSQHFEPEISVSCTEEINCDLDNTSGMNKKKMRRETFKDDNLHEIDIIHENAINVKADDNGSNKNLIIKQSLKDDVHRYKTVRSVVKKTAENNSNKISVSKISDNPVEIDTPFPDKKNAITKTNLDHSKHSLETSRINSNSKILTFQNPKNIASIINISQLPSNLISNKKVIVIGKNSHNVIYNKNEMTTKKDSIITIMENSNIQSNTSTQNMNDSNIKKQEVTGKIITKNGKKYLIKQTKNIKDPKSSSNLSIVRNTTKATEQQPISDDNASESRLTSTSSNETENIGMEQTTSFHNNIFVLTPSPSPSELSSSSSCDLHAKKTSVMPKLLKIPPHLVSISAVQQTQNYIFETISLIKEENGDLYMDTKIVDRITRESFRDVCDVIIKYKQEMYDEFLQMNSLELNERIDHLQCAGEEMLRVLSFMLDNLFKEKLRPINILQQKLRDCLNTCNQDVPEKRNDDVILNEWETKINPIHKCSLCNRLIKPKSYIAGFSKLPKDEKVYCSCYKRVCHTCSTYQGTVAQFFAHTNMHKNSKPYVCPDCHLKFISAKSLEVHIWTVCFHMSKKVIFTCKICDIDGFRDLESITRHYAIMHSKMKIGCEDCSRVFLTYDEYVQHCTEAHPSKTEQKPIRLVICKLSNVISRCENYMSYLEKYPGVRKLIWYKCPFCPLMTTNNKHVTTLLNNHFRYYHKESLSKVLSKEAFIEIFGTRVINKTISIQMPFRMDDIEQYIVPKIVNTRTISSEIFEHGTQDTEYKWSSCINKVNKNLQAIKGINDKEKKELLPKIINVRSISDLKSSKSKDESIMKCSTETKKKSNSLQDVIQIDDEKVDSFIHEETEMELDESSSNEETARTKEPDKGKNELAMNTFSVPESEKSLLIDAVDVRVNPPVVSSKTSERSTGSHIKIVDFRKLCKPDTKQFVTAEMCNIQKDENASYIPRPPPLARMPQHLLEPVEVIELDNEPADSSKTSKSKKSLVRRITNKSKVRIALGTDEQMKESIDYSCHLCNERINTSQLVIQTHFREKHSDEYRMAIITPQLSRMSPDFINGGYKKFINNRKRKSDSGLFGPSKRKRRWTPRKHAEMKDANPPVGLCVKQETAEDGEGNFICKKCDQRRTDMSDLREHIATNHRLKDGYLICLECGENFVVAPSLQMHLKAFHGIEDPINYMNQNPSYAPDSDLQMGARTTVPNQCYVCMAVFEDKAAVDKHLRVHGMAFLNRKRIEARNALEKKTSPQEEKSSIIKNDSKEAAKQDKPAETILEKINAAI